MATEPPADETTGPGASARTPRPRAHIRLSLIVLGIVGLQAGIIWAGVMLYRAL